MRTNRSTFAAIATSTAIMLAGCSEPRPAAQDVQWSLEPLADKQGYQFKLVANVTPGLGGWYQPVITVVDERGCRSRAETDETQVMDTAAPDPLHMQANYKFEKFPHRVATAEATLIYSEIDPTAGTADGVRRTQVFSETRTIDPIVKVKQNPVNACGKPKVKSQQTPPSQSGQDTAATIINLRGYLCGQVTDIYPRGSNALVVHCTLYRDRRGKAQYLVHTDTASVERLD
ncbi:hypothetical protein [Sphingobium sp. KCTC 72723]|uniref:hypothetical protein n=1 Tax=Sphingobium sp. KCTC 72723 TaxID=2733867 RepID=UPI00165E4E64|nr:hypothetical protein [Sphingobium sp. KCTC 72723]